jgi:Ca2+-binding RTX toxin-like protein
VHSIDQVHDGFGKNEHGHSMSTNSNHNIEHNGNNDNVTKVLMGSSNQMSSCDYISSTTTTGRTQAVTDENHASSFVGINDKSNKNKKISEELETGSNHTSHISFSQSIRSNGRGIGLTASDNLVGNTGAGNNDDSDSIISVLGGSDSQPDRTLCGGPNDDVLFGSPGNDIIYGGAGSDKLFGGPGNDILIGGQNADYFDRGPGIDTIRDFHAIEGDIKTNDCENY